MGRGTKWAMLAAVLLVGCSTGYSIVGTPDGGGDALGFPDGTDGSTLDGTTFDSTTGADTSAPPLVPIVCNNDCRDYVVSRLVLPTPATAGSVGVDHDGDGNIDNALAAILGTLASLTLALDPQQALDEAVYSGESLMLLRIQANSFTSAAHAVAQAWRGADQACCSTPSDLAQCKSQAMASCFDGSHAFKPHTETPNTALMAGAITGGVCRFGPAKMTFTIKLSDAGLIDLALVNVHIKGTLSGNKLTGGVLAGAIPKSEIDAKLLPMLTGAINDVLADPTAAQSTKDMILGLFDVDKNGTIDANEVQGNALIKTLLAGDVDIDKDGNKEMSLGLSFEAVPAVIN